MRRELLTWSCVGCVAFSITACSGDDEGGATSTGGAAGSAGQAGTGGAAGADGGPTGGSAGSAASAGGGAGGADASTDASTDAGPGALLGKFELTYYWVTTEAEFSGTKDTKLYDKTCKVLATVTASFAASLKLEGTGKLDDGRLLNYDGACSCPTSPCYLVADAQHPWGYGVQGWALVPFRSIAVDKNEIPYGTKLYIPEIDGVTMPGQAPWGAFVHDGCVSADDTGGAIVGKHIDWFVALKSGYTSLDSKLNLTQVTVHQGGELCP